ncbi:MLP-like protein 31 [Bienertia sinuspersici]
MAKLQKVEGQIELKCHAYKFFEVWCQKPYLVTKMCPKKFPKIELHEGDWHKVGGVTTWNYVFIIA